MPVFLVEISGIEPLDLLNARQALSQLSYTPVFRRSARSAFVLYKNAGGFVKPFFLFKEKCRLSRCQPMKSCVQMWPSAT